MHAQRTLKWFFWIAFAVFLLASIPHVAYFFRAFEPADGAWYWLIAYAIALSIDITVFLLSLTVAELRQKNVDAWIVSSVWFFIVVLAGLSWFMNWEYATQFASHMLARPESSPMVNLVNPIIASCFQVLAIAYTWISDKIAQSGTVETGHLDSGTVVNVNVLQNNGTPTTPVLDAVGTSGQLPAGHTQQDSGTVESAHVDTTDNGTLDKVRDILSERPTISVRQLAKELDMPKTTAANWRLKALETVGR